MRPALGAIAGELRDGDELIVVDNGSADGTPEAVRESAPRATLIEAGANLGFAAGCNRGAAIELGRAAPVPEPRRRGGDRLPRGDRGAARGAPGLGRVAGPGDRGRGADDQHPRGGGPLHRDRLGRRRRASRSARGRDRAPSGEPGFVSGACLAIPSSEFDELGGFAEDFFLYHEDVDLSLRLRLAGGRLGVEAGARVDHDYEFEKGPAKWRRLERNRWATLIRTYPAGAAGACSLPALLATELALVPVSVAGGWFTQKLASWIDVLRWLPRLRRERRGDPGDPAGSRAAAFARSLTADLDSPYLGAAGRSRAAARAAARLLVRRAGAAARLSARPPARRPSRCARSRASPLRPRRARGACLGVEPRHLLGEDLRLLGEPRVAIREVKEQEEDHAEARDGTARSPGPRSRSRVETCASSSFHTASTSRTRATTIHSSA